jgi:hypothetical protein
MMTVRQLNGFWLKKRLNKVAAKKIVMTLFVGALIFFCTSSFAAEIMKYQVVPGSDDKAYLVDTTTGAVWVLTYRTLATGREPIAIPYKFIKMSPKMHHEFLVETIQGASMPPSEKP